MVSATQQSSRIRRRKASTNGKVNKRVRRQSGTPAFPIHLDAQAAKPAAAKAATAKAPATKPAAAKPAAAPAKPAAKK
jgi:hypothetical protein